MEEDPLEFSLKEIEIIKRFAATCDALEDAVRAGQGFDIEEMLLDFPIPYRDKYRSELIGIVEELKGSRDSKKSDRSEGTIYDSKCQYTEVAPLAQGGMGRVLVALDENFSRQVALKVIQPDSADDERYQKRFLQESLITARLEHPGILPIYSLGVNSDDQPFYTMRLVSGETAKTLTQAIKELHREAIDKQASNLLRRQLLRRLIDVCNTVAYAHSQGVCHRDLKPANILIGPFGETLVVDWGLAKFFKDPKSLPKPKAAGLFTKHSDASTEKSSSPPLSRTHSDGVGTRGYVAPESYRSESIVDWPRLDVYSLGAILYCILTSKSPGSESSGSLGERSGSYKLQRPRQIVRDIPKALEAVYLKALSPERELRYSTPLELASDIERFLAGQPVSVLRDGLVDRLVRWVSNNRKLAISMLVFGSLLTFAIGVIALQQWSYNASLAEKSQKLTESLTNEMELREKEQKARELAQLQQQIALDRELLALKALRTYTDAITSNETLKNAEGLGQVRRELLEKPIALFEQIQQSKTGTLELSWGYLEQLAKMSEELAKISFEYGDPVQCSRWNDRSIELYEDLVSKAQEPEVSIEESKRRIRVSTLPLAGSYRLRGALQMPMDKQASNDSLQHALELLQKVSEDPIGKEPLLNELANIHVYQAILGAEQGDVQRMATNFDLAIKEREELLQLAKSSSPSSQQNQAALIANREIELESLRQDQAYVGLVLRHGDAQAHFQQIERHIGFLKKQIEQGVTLEQNRLRLTWATRNLAVHLRSYGQLDKSTSMLLEALELRRQMTALYPSVTRYKVDLAGTAIDLAGTMKDLGKIDQAIRYAQEGIEGYRSVLKELPEETSYRVDLASQLHFLGHLYWDNFQDNQANEVFQESYQLAEKILASNPNNPLIQALYPELLWHQSQAQCLRGDWQAARDSLRTYWNAQYGTGNSNIRPAKDPASILELWKHCCLRTGDATAIKEVERLQSQFPQEDNKEQSDDISPQVQIQRLVRSAEASILAADKALLDQQSQEAYRLEQESLKHMQEVLGVIRSQPKEWKQQPGRLLEVWDLTLRNPSFLTVCVPSELDRWPSEHRQDWESIWREIRSLTTDQTDQTD